MQFNFRSLTLTSRQKTEHKKRERPERSLVGGPLVAANRHKYGLKQHKTTVKKKRPQKSMKDLSGWRSNTVAQYVA